MSSNPRHARMRQLHYSALCLQPHLRLLSGTLRLCGSSTIGAVRCVEQQHTFTHPVDDVKLMYPLPETGGVQEQAKQSPLCPRCLGTKMQAGRETVDADHTGITMQLQLSLWHQPPNSFCNTAWHQCSPAWHQHHLSMPYRCCCSLGMAAAW